MTTTDYLIQVFQTRGESALINVFNTIGQGAGNAEDKMTSLGKAGSAFALVGAGTTAAAVGLNRLTHSADDVYRSAESADAKLQEMLRTRGEPAAFEGMKKFDADYGLKIGVNTEDLEQADVNLLGFGIHAKDVNALLPGLSAQSKSYNKNLAEVATQVGKGIADADLAGLHRAAITIDPSVLKTFDEFKKVHTSAENSAEAFRLVQDALKNYAANAENSMGAAEKAQARYNVELHRTQEAFGKGSSEAQTKLYEMGAKFMEKLDKNPKALEELGRIAGYVAPMAAAVGPVMLVAGAWMKMKDSANLATLAKNGLTKATLGDIGAEKEKAGVAGLEQKALAGVGGEAESNVAKIGKLAAARAFLGKPFSIGGMNIPQVGGGQLSMGGAAVSAGLGLGAASLTLGDSKALGLSDGQAEMYAGVTGAVTAGVSAIYPPARLFIAAGEAMGLAIDKFYSEPREKAAMAGTGADNSDLYGAGMGARLEAAQKAGNRLEVANIYDFMSRKAKASGDTVSAQTYARDHDIQKDLAGRENTRNSPEYLARIEREAKPGGDIAWKRAQLEASPESMAAYGRQNQAAFADRMRAHARPEARRVGGAVEITFAPVRFDDPAGRQAMRMNDEDVRGANG